MPFSYVVSRSPRFVHGGLKRGRRGRREHSVNGGLLNDFGVGVSCRNLYSFVVYLYVNGSGSITSVGEERANLSAVVYL